MSDAFIPPAPEHPDHRSAALEDALALIEGRIASTKNYFNQKKADGADRDGIQHALGMITGLADARQMLLKMRRASSDA